MARATQLFGRGNLHILGSSLICLGLLLGLAGIFNYMRLRHDLRSVIHHHPASTP